MRKEFHAYLIIFACALVLPWLLPNRYLLGVAVLIGIYTLMAVGLNLLLGYAGQISLGHAAFYGLGAYSAAVLTTRWSWPSGWALVASVLITALVAAVIGRPALKLKSHYLAMATLGFGLVVQICLAEMVDLTGGSQGLSGIPKLSLMGLTFSDDFQMYFLVWGLVALVQAGILNLTSGKIGRAFLAIHSNEEAVASLGINAADLKLMVFVLSAALAGLAGGLYSFSINYISPEPFGLSFSILLVTMVIVGGMGHPWGPVLGAVLLGILPEVLRVFKDFDMLIYGLLLMVVIIFLPQGLIALGRRSDFKLKLIRRKEARS